MSLKREMFQEEQYSIPYHYKDLFCEETKLLLGTAAEFRIDLLCSTVKRLNPKSILDVGCGDGKLIYKIKGWCSKNKVYLCGADYDKKAISFARAFNPEITFTTEPLSKLKRKFDLIVLAEVIEHIPKEKAGQFLKEISMHLSKNGKLVITTPTKSLPLLPKHYQHFTLEILKETLTPYFTVLESTGFQRKGIQEKIYKFFRAIGSLMYPVRHKFHLINYYSSLREYYFQNLGRCKIDDGYHLMAVCGLSKS